MSEDDTNAAPEVGGVRIASAGRACDNDRCSVLVYNPEGPRYPGSIVNGCPGCGSDGFAVRFGVGIDGLSDGDALGGEPS